MILLCWGANNFGQLGLGFKSDSEVSPREVNLSQTEIDAEDIVSIAGGAGHTLVLTRKGLVYSCGWNSKGQLGASDDSLKFLHVEILAPFRIVQIACGWDFSAAISDCGKQFVWGNNAYTQLGLSKSITCTGIPSRLQVSQKLATGFRQVSCGMRHAAMLTKDGGLLVAGTGKKGQLGLGDAYDDNNYLSITKVLDMEEITSIAAGQHHTVVLKNSGAVWSWGDNKFGQAGLALDVSNSFIPVKIFDDANVTSVHAGWTHSALLTETGEVLTWGRNTYGQLGSQRDVAHTPEQIPGLTDVSQLGLGSEHNLAVTKDGKLFVWGWNEHGSCGTGDKRDVLKPTQILKDRKVILAFACTGSSFAVVE